MTPRGYLNVKNGRGQLETAATYGDFVLQLECIANGTQLNSGIFIRCIPGDVMMGYECQIDNRFEGAASNAASVAQAAFDRAFADNPLTVPDLGLAAAADAARGREIREKLDRAEIGIDAEVLGQVAQHASQRGG